jgi:5'-methylthioadenosine phosphorylase
MYAASGIDVINMTQYPEAYLAREIGMCYAGVALVTDRDAGVAGDPSVEAVTAKAAFEVMEANVEHAKRLLASVIRELPDGDECACSQGGAGSLRKR